MRGAKKTVARIRHPRHGEDLHEAQRDSDDGVGSDGWPGRGEDVDGAKDHPLLTRYPDSFITEYTRNYNATEFQVGARGTPAKVQTVEGDTTTLRYFYESPEKQPSPLQLMRNYQNAVKQIGGAVVYERLPKDLDAGETTLQVTTGGKDVWIKVICRTSSARRRRAISSSSPRSPRWRRSSAPTSCCRS